MDRREYVCNQMYKQHDLLRKGSWTDADKLEYMELNIAPYSRYWRMGMKKALKHAIRLLREEEENADRKTEPTISKMEQVDKPTTQTETQNSNLTFKTLEYCDICDHKGCEECIANALDEHCMPSQFKKQIEGECAKEYEELGLKELKELIKADRKTENSSEKPNNCEHITEDGVTCAKYPACDDCLDNPLNKVKGSERLVKGSEQTEPTGYNLLPVDKDINVRSKDEEYINNLPWVEVGNGEQTDEPQTDCAWGKCE